MKKSTSRFVRLLSVLLVLLTLFTAAIPASAANLSAYNTNGDKSVSELKQLYPNGAYFNGSGRANGITTYTWSPCGHKHGSCSSRYGWGGACGCGTFKSCCLQCMAFAYALQYYAFSGFNGYTQAVSVKNYDQAMAQIKPGDVIRVNGHSMFVIAVDGNYITVAEANRDGKCGIEWGRQMTKASLKSGFSYLDPSPRTLKGASNNLANIVSGVAGAVSRIVSGGSAHSMRVTAKSGLNMRSGPATSYSVVTAIPSGYTVTAYETQNGFTRVSWNGKTGWCSSSYLS